MSMVNNAYRALLPEGKIYNSFEGMWSNAVILVWKFFARTSFGIWAVQSVRRNVESSLKLPSSKTYIGRR